MGQLFGYRKGAFTGAVQTTKGVIREASVQWVLEGQIVPLLNSTALYLCPELRKLRSHMRGQCAYATWKQAMRRIQNG